jgi:hypothetical protein
LAESISFNPRARAGRDQQPERNLPRCLCFNPRARAGRDYSCSARFVFVNKVSIHAPARGATTTGGAAATDATQFQSTRPRGARPTCPWSGIFVSLRVSIHAPARGATRAVSAAAMSPI